MFGTSGGGFRVARIFGIDVLVDWTWLFLVVLSWQALRLRFVFAYPRQASVLAAAATAGFALSILIHELSHAIVGRVRGQTVRRIRLFFFGGATEFATDSPRASDEFLVTAVGPGSSLGLAVIGWLLANAIKGSWAEVFGYLAWLNLILGIFNFVPAFPLDGGRILRAIVWGATGQREQGTLVAARAGQILGGALLALGIYGLLAGDVGGIFRTFNPIGFAFIGFMIMASASAALQGIATSRMLASATAADLMWERPVAVHPNEDLARVSYMFPDAAYPAFPVVEDQGRVVGILTVGGAHAQAGSDLSRSDRRVWQVMEPVGRTVGPDANGTQVAEAMEANGGQRVLVVDPWGRLLGMVTADGILNRRSRTRGRAFP